MDEHCTDTDGFCRPDSPKHRVTQEIGSESFPLPGAIDGEPAEKHNRDWVRHVAAGFAGRQIMKNRPSRQAVIADAPLRPLAQHVGTRCTFQFVPAGIANQPVV